MENVALRELLNNRFSGLLKSGSHSKNGEACALELVSEYRGTKWTDDPSMVDMPDIRPLNDARWLGDEARTQAMLPLIEALIDWPQWEESRREDYCKRIALRTIQEILPMALDAIRVDSTACRRAKTLTAARAAAWAAAGAAAGDAAWAARAAARAAAGAAAGAARDAAWAARAAAWAAAGAARDAAWAAAGDAAWAARAAAWAAAGAARDAGAAAWAAGAAGAAGDAAGAAGAAGAAAWAARDAGAAAGAAGAAGDAVLVLACRIWTEEANNGKRT